jgi:hypothetical protein
MSTSGARSGPWPITSHRAPGKSKEQPTTDIKGPDDRLDRRLGPRRVGVPRAPTVDHVRENTEVSVHEKQVLIWKVFRSPVFEVWRRASTVYDRNPADEGVRQCRTHFLTGRSGCGLEQRVDVAGAVFLSSRGLAIAA